MTPTPTTPPTTTTVPPPVGEALARLVRSALGREIARVEALAPGLGTRSFYRLTLQGDATPQRVIARVSAPEDPALRPPGVPAEPALEPLRSFLEAAGMPVPALYGGDESLSLLEDFGDRTLGDLSPAERPERYREACDWLPKLQRLEASADRIPAFGRRLDGKLLAYKAGEIERRLLPWALGRAPNASEQSALTRAFAEIEAALRDAPLRLSHRDYKAANLHLRESDGRVCWIDLQGAFLAPPEYDLVCLLRDAQVALDDEEIEQHLEHTCRALPDAATAAVHRERFDLFTVSRVGKDLSRYRYAELERADDRYVRHYATAQRHLGRALERLRRTRPAFEPLAGWIGTLGERIADEANP